MGCDQVIALDPGGHTGWAVWDHTFGFRYGIFRKQNHHSDLYRWLENECYRQQGVKIVSESFEYRNTSKPGLELISREYIGVTKLFCQKHLTVDYVAQTASMGKITARSFVKRANLVKLGLWDVVDGEMHAMDALGHLLYYMIHNDHPQKMNLLRQGWK